MQSKTARSPDQMASLARVRCPRGHWVLAWDDQPVMVSGVEHRITRVVVRDGVINYQSEIEYDPARRQEGGDHGRVDVHSGRCGVCRALFRWEDPNGASSWWRSRLIIEAILSRRSVEDPP